jgi:hypothetical protein
MLILFDIKMLPIKAVSEKTKIKKVAPRKPQ